ERGLVKKTPLAAYSRPLKSGIIAIKLREGDSLVDVVVAGPGDEIVLATERGMAIRFKQSDARPVGRNSNGVKGIRLVGDDKVVGMVVADPDATLLTVCANGYGKRTPFGSNLEAESDEDEGWHGHPARVLPNTGETPVPPTAPDTGETPVPPTEETEEDDDLSSGHCYRTQRRGGKGLRDIKTSKRNGPVVGIVHVSDEDELMMITARGKIQRIAASDVSIIGRNTQGVRIMSLDDDTLVAVKRVPKEENGRGEEA
ncbi:MAG: DNA gyrase subunit A, partial [Planctomycetes bacterium]|nr:DNA gyrase subunit A [Planctomycetota bacterium]